MGDFPKRLQVGLPGKAYWKIMDFNDFLEENPAKICRSVRCVSRCAMKTLW